IAEAYSKLASVYARIAKTTDDVKLTRGHTRDPNRPKRPETSYLLYSKENRNSILSGFPDISPRDIPSKIGEMWAALPEDRRQEYKDKANLLKAQYDIDMKKYNAQMKTKPAGAIAKDTESEPTRTNGTDASATDNVDGASDAEVVADQHPKKPKKKQHTKEGAEKRKKKTSKPKEDGSVGSEDGSKKKKRTK
ncbi:FACT complex subunit ssrp1, partial [Coemansia sp. RSA 1933]